MLLRETAGQPSTDGRGLEVDGKINRRLVDADRRCDGANQSNNQSTAALEQREEQARQYGHHDQVRPRRHRSNNN